MSENNTNKKIYVPGTQLKEFKFESGGSVIRLSINKEKFVPFFKEHVNENGYINFNINKRQEVGQFGDTHSLTLDTWKPTKNKSESTVPKKTTVAPKAKAVAKKSEPEPEVEDPTDGF